MTACSTPLWWDAVTGYTPRTRLEGDVDADVAIVGAGYTGLWTAHYLLEEDPALRIVVVERDHVGYGASGRNGGWCYDGFAASLERIERESDLQTARRFAAALRASVDEVGRVADQLGLDIHYRKGGSIEFLRNRGQLARAEADVAAARRYGWTDDELRVVGPDEALDIARASGVLGGLVSAHAAAIQPALLVHGLADVLERRGVRIFENTPATSLQRERVDTPTGTVRAPMIVQATEGYTARMPGLKRRLVPLYSLMIATEPLSDALWSDIGLADHQLFSDYRHLVIYGQRTMDGRIAFGGRGAPYDYGSRIRDGNSFQASDFEYVRLALVDLFPQLEGVAITHRWSGVLGVSRDWYPRVVIDRRAGIAWAGGYVGSGVAVSNLAGRTLAQLVVGHDGELTCFPWVNRSMREWEPEPFRWLGINGALAVMKSADRVEARTGKPAHRAELLWRLVG